jgi:hypothetical protein
MEVVMGSAGYGYCRLDGTIAKTADRQRVVDKFNADPSKLGEGPMNLHTTCVWQDNFDSATERSSH